MALRRSSLSTVRQISDINLTPLMDLTFLLLITFIITFPLVENGIPINLPRGKADALDRTQRRAITVDAGGGLYLDDVRITFEQLAREMQELGAANPDITVLVRADQGLVYRELVKVLKVLHDASISRVALVTQGG